MCPYEQGRAIAEILSRAPSLPEPTSCAGIFIVGELKAHRAPGLDKNVHKCRHRLFAYPVPLQLTGQLHPADWFRPGLFDSPEGRLVSFDRGAADRIHYRIDL